MKTNGCVKRDKWGHRRGEITAFVDNASTNAHGSGCTSLLWRGPTQVGTPESCSRTGVYAAHLVRSVRELAARNRLRKHERFTTTPEAVD